MPRRCGSFFVGFCALANLVSLAMAQPLNREPGPILVQNETGKEGGAGGQMPPSAPDVTVVVREHPTSADMVEVTMSRPDYPTELLREQMLRLGAELGSQPRGLTVAVESLDPTNKNLQFVKARFAVDGILDREGGRLDIQPILRAFAGAPDPHTIESLLIIFDGEQPTSRTVKRHSSETVEAEATFVSAPAEIEYHIRLKTQDPAKITFPDRAPEQKAQPEPSANQSGNPVLFWAALAAAALAVGALVYLALLRSGGGKSRRDPD